MAKICNVCKQSYADNLAVCPHCASAIELVLGDAPKSPSGSPPPAAKGPLRAETGSDSEIEIDLGTLPQPTSGAPDSAISNVKWSALVSSSSDSGVDLSAGGLTLDSPSDVALLGPKTPAEKAPPAKPGKIDKSSSWTDITLGTAGNEGSGIVVEDGSGIVLEAAKGQPGAGPGSGSDDDIDLARLEAESKAPPRALPQDGSGVVVEGTSPGPVGKIPLVESGSGSDIELGVLAAESEEVPSSQFAEHLRDDSSEVRLGQASQRRSRKGPEDLDLVADALESGVDVADRGKAAGPAAGDSGVDLAALFEDEKPAGKKGKKSASRPTDASAVDLGAMLPNVEDEGAAKGWRTPTSSDVQLAGNLQAGSDVDLAGSDPTLGASDVGLAGSSGRLGESDVQLGGSDVGLAGSSSGQRKRQSDVQLGGSDVGLAGSSGGKRGGQSDVQLAGSDVGLAGSSGGKRGGPSDVQLAGSDVALAGSSSGGQSDVQLAGSDVALADGSSGKLGQSAVQLGDDEEVDLASSALTLGDSSAAGLAVPEELVAEEDRETPSKSTLVVERKPAGMSPLVGGVIGAVLSTAACVGLWFSGLLPGSQSGSTTPPASGTEAKVKELQDKIEQLQGAEGEAAKNAKLVQELQDELKGAEAKAANAGQEAIKAETARKLADKAAQDAEAARKQALLALEEAKKSVEQKAKELAKKDAEAAELKIADLEKARKAAEQNVATLEKEVKAAEKKAADLGLASKLAQARADEAAAEVAALRKRELALNAELAEAKKAADPKALELLKKDRDAATLKIAQVEKDRKAAEQQVAELTAALKEAKAGKGNAVVQKLLETARAEAADAKKRLDDATQKLDNAQQTAALARAEAEKAKKSAAEAQLAVKNLKEMLVKSGADGKRPIFPVEATDPLEAEEQYTSGVRSFQGGDYAQAERAFFEAARHGGQDARYLYYLGLARHAQGKTNVAEDDFREAAQLERQNKPGSSSVNRALERVQGPARQILERYRQ